MRLHSWGENKFWSFPLKWRVAAAISYTLLRLYFITLTPIVPVLLGNKIWLSKLSDRHISYVSCCFVLCNKLKFWVNSCFRLYLKITYFAPNPVDKLSWVTFIASRSYWSLIAPSFRNLSWILSKVEIMGVKSVVVVPSVSILRHGSISLASLFSGTKVDIWAKWTWTYEQDYVQILFF